LLWWPSLSSCDADVGVVVLLSGAAAGKPVSIAASSESGAYSTTMRFDDQGDARLVVDVRTSDGRTIATDFPLAIIAAPVNAFFWYGLLAVLVGAAATLPAFRIIGRRDQGVFRGPIRPIAASATLLLAGIAAVSLLVPIREQREPGGSAAFRSRSSHNFSSAFAPSKQVSVRSSPVSRRRAWSSRGPMRRVSFRRRSQAD
jgi:hypothetical protein